MKDQKLRSKCVQGLITLLRNLFKVLMSKKLDVNCIKRYDSSRSRHEDSIVN